MDAGFMDKLEAARGECMFPWIITAGFRTPEHNTQLGGAPDSWHLKGMAADIACTDSAKRYAIIHAATQIGILGVEVCPDHVHLDNRPEPCLFLGVDK